MSNRIKFLVSVIAAIAVIFSCGKKNTDKSENSDKEKQKTIQQKDTVKINKDQYRVAEIFSGSKNQIIDLIQGPANFEIQYMGQSHFKATLMHPDGKVIDVLAESDGPVKLKKKVDVPETRAYILDVKTTGDWSVYRE
jgi:hypothetical protein